MTEFNIEGSHLTVVPVVKGLVSEAERIQILLDNNSPDIVAVSISPEELEGLRNRSSSEEYVMSEVEMAYSKLLSEFGEVELPPPCFTSVVEFCDGNGIPLVASDMDEIAFTEAYCDLVKVRDMFHESMITRKILRTKFDVSDLHNFVLEWDRRLNKPKGLNRLEKRREHHIASSLVSVCNGKKRIIAFIELERADGVIDALDSDDQYSTPFRAMTP